MSDEFRIDEEHLGPETVVLAVHGEADLNHAGELKDRLEGAIDDGATVLVIDLSGVTFVDSMTLGILLSGMKRLRARGGQFRIVTPRAEIRRIFEITLLDQVFALDATRVGALAATDGSPRSGAAV